MLTQERSIWSTIFAHLRTIQALPCSRTEFTAMSPQQAEHTLLSASEVEACFLKSKEHILYHIPAVKRTHTPACSWRMLAFISGVLLLSADDHAVVIWDTSMHALRSSTVVPTPLARFTLSNFLCHVYDNSTLYIAVSLTHANFQRSVVSFTFRLSLDHVQCSHLFCFPLFPGDK